MVKSCMEHKIKKQCIVFMCFRFSFYAGHICLTIFVFETSHHIKICISIRVLLS